MPSPRATAPGRRLNGLQCSQCLYLLTSHSSDTSEALAKDAPTRHMASRLIEASSGLLVSLDDLASGGEPHAMMLFHMGDGALQVFDPQRLARNHRM